MSSDESTGSPCAGRSAVHAGLWLSAVAGSPERAPAAGAHRAIVDEALKGRRFLSESSAERTRQEMIAGCILARGRTGS